MTPFINEHFVEINQYPRFGENLDLFTIREYFHYNSLTPVYGARGTIIPTKYIDGFPNESTIEFVINNKIPIIRRVIDLNNQKESWIFDTNILEETKK